jgi:mono/diheme cytochrome c family protein
MRYTVPFLAVWFAFVTSAAALQHDVPAPSTPKSIADGASAYNRSCASCHGKTGMGDGPAGKQLNPPPSNLVDAEWKHGATDAEIFTVIRSGVPKTAMRGFASKMTEHEIWDVINYVRSLGPAPAK